MQRTSSSRIHRTACYSKAARRKRAANVDVPAMRCVGSGAAELTRGVDFADGAGAGRVAGEALTGRAATGDLLATTSTAFAVPKTFGISSVAAGSSTHSPSTTKRYSWRPGSSGSSFAHMPSFNRIIGVTLGCQSLNEPAMQALCAVGCVSSRHTHCESQPGA